MNSESKAISLCLKYVKQRKPELKWIISFADGMMGKVGTIYQATNFVYTGFRKDGGIWMTKEGDRLHSVSLWHKHKTINRGILEGIYGTPLFKVFGGQHRYFHFYDKKYKNKLIVPIQPYPKASELKNHLNIKIAYKDTNDNFDAFMHLLNMPKQIKRNKQTEKLSEFFTI